MPPPVKYPKTTLIIRRRSLDEDEPQSIGTWKIAYADFVTAMMAFFMLLWLVSITTPEQRDGIADYFNPISVSNSNSGADGQLAGRAVDSDGSLTEKAGSTWETIPAARVPTLSPAGPDRLNPLDGAEGSGKAGEMGADAGVDMGNAGRADAEGDLTLGEVKAGDVAVGAALDPALQEQLSRVWAEERAFDRIEEQVRDALNAAVDLSDLSQNLVFERTAEGLRIQITDRPHFSMFEVGSVELNPRAVGLMRIVADALAAVPNRIAVAGHTDSRAFAATARYTNWELSADRANAARRVLTVGGIPPARLARIEGLADTLHIYPDEPEDARNRRISITVLRRAALPGGGRG